MFRLIREVSHKMAPLDADMANLQRNAADPTVMVSQLVREGLTVATRINDEQVALWLRREMNGYVAMRDAPEYRWARGQVRVMNPYRGWIPIIFEDPAVEERLSKVATTQGVGEIEALLARNTSRDTFGLQLPPNIARQLLAQEPYMTNPSVHVPRVMLERVLDSVRNRILEWTLTHGTGEQRGPRDAAAAGKQLHVVIEGSVVDSQIQIANSRSDLTVVDTGVDVDALRGALDALRAALPSLGLRGDAAAQVKADLQALDSQATSPKPRHDLLRALARGLAVRWGEGPTLTVPISSARVRDTGHRASATYGHAAGVPKPPRLSMT